MRVTVFSAKSYDRISLLEASSRHKHQVTFVEPRLERTTCALAAGAEAICLFVNDVADAETLGALRNLGVRAIALRCAGFNNIDLAACKALGIRIARVPAYSPHAVAEHAVGLMLMLNRKLHRAYNRVREGNFSLDGLLGFNLKGKTVAVIGTGRIGVATALIMKGFGCSVIAHDLSPDRELCAQGIRYVGLDEALSMSDIVSLHLPLNDGTRHLIDHAAIGRMKSGAMLINTGRGGLIDTAAVIEGLKSGRIGALGLDVYEREGDLFFEDRSGTVIADDLFSRLLTFPNVVITGHQAFFTREALAEIAEKTMANLTAFEHGRTSGNDL